jgi:hypothetical protein
MVQNIALSEKMLHCKLCTVSYTYRLHNMSDGIFVLDNYDTF